MALNKVIDRAYLEIAGDQVLCDSIDIDPEDDSDFVTAMTPDNEPLGTTHGNRRHRLRADVTMRETEDVDFHYLWVENENFTAEIQFEDGTIWAFSHCEISKPGVSASHGEKATWSLDLLAWGLQIS